MGGELKITYQGIFRQEKTGYENIGSEFQKLGIFSLHAGERPSEPKSLEKTS